MNATSIEWTNYSCTPLKMQMPDGALINACIKISPGCSRCYAESIVRRFWHKDWGEFPGYSKALLRIGKPVLVEKELQAVLRLSERIAAGKADPAINKIFWNDMTDEFLEFWPDEFLDRLFAVRALTPNLIHQVLTKRAERMRDYFADLGSVHGCMQRWYWAAQKFMAIDAFPEHRGEWDWTMESPGPLDNCWLGVSVENQEQADRIPMLLRTPAAVRFLSVEPMLGPVDLETRGYLTGRSHVTGGCVVCGHPVRCRCEPGFPSIDWVIVGGESGPGARPCDVAWIRSIVQQCKAAGVACFVKQLGSEPRPSHLPSDVKVRFIKDRKGGAMKEWPEDLRVRQFPSTEAPCTVSPSTMTRHQKFSIPLTWTLPRA